MRFTWFNLMPWPYLPDDFREKYRSVWVDIPNRLYDPVKGHHVYHEYMDQLEYADSLGFDGIGVNEHHQNGYGLMPSPNLIAATLARRTSRSAICVIGNSIAGYNPPIRVAEEFAMLDVISGGRLVAGFPVGTPMDTNFCYGQIPALTRDKYREAHDLIMRAWRAEEPFAFDGKYTQLRWVNCWPKPIQKPHPPIYIPGGGSIETWDFCLDYDYNYSYLSFFGYLRAKSLIDGYWNLVARRGKDESPYRAGFAQIICVAESDAEAERLYAEHVLYFFNRCLHLFGPFTDPPGYRTISTIKFGALSAFQKTGLQVLEDLTWGRLLEERFVVAGGPETVRQQLEECIRGLRVGHLFCLFHNGNMPDWKTRLSSTLFAERVMPKLRDVWPEWKHDDRWMPKPMADRRRPEENLPARVGTVARPA
jgi:alkanesulfonate monooxygenase SsuD/methylene tetrahydromethanopterin reductase-like flavin-dependent oxidoreductase (luciferase family)